MRSLVEVVYSAAQNYSEHLLFDFFVNGHPARNRVMNPCGIKIINTSKREKMPFGIFVAIKDINQKSNRPLVQRETVEAYKKQYPFISQADSFESWDDILRCFQCLDTIGET